MTAIAWAIIIYTVISDSTSKEVPNFAYGLASMGLVFIMVLTVKDMFK